VGPSPAKPADLEEEKLSLRDKLKALEELQKVDLETNELRAEAESIPRRRAEIEAAVGEARSAYDAEKARLQENEKERRQLESLLGMERDKVKKWEGRLGEIRTPREYAALSREIDIAKKSNDTQQEQIKTLAEAAGEIQKGLDAREEALAQCEEDAHAELEALRKKGAEFEESRGSGPRPPRRSTRRSSGSTSRSGAGGRGSPWPRWRARPARAATATSLRSSPSCCSVPTRSRPAPTATASSTSPRR
jgi:hypothetical protein